MTKQEVVYKLRVYFVPDKCPKLKYVSKQRKTRSK